MRFYEEVMEDIADFERRGCSGFEERIAELKRVLQELHNDYKSSLGPAERQMDWGGTFCGGSAEVQGGRADGNK